MEKYSIDNNGAPLWSSMTYPDDPSQQIAFSYDASDIADALGLTLSVSDQATENAALNAQVERTTSTLSNHRRIRTCLTTRIHSIREKGRPMIKPSAMKGMADEGEAMTTLNTRNIYSLAELSMLV